MAYTNFTGPVQADFGFQTASYTVADLPAVEDNIFLIASDANGGVGTVVFGKNGQWIDARTDQPVSTNPPTPVPYVGAIVPDLGPTTGGQSVSIYGFNFTGATAVTIGGTAVQSFSVVNDGQIDAVTGARAAGLDLSVNVTNAYGTNPNNILYSYEVPGIIPVITSTSVAGGYVQGGSCNFTINGTGFTGVYEVRFNGVSASYTFVSDTQILITNIPVGFTGSATIEVFAGGGISNPYTGWSYVQTAVITSITPNTASNAGGTSLTVAGYGFNTSTQMQFVQPGYSNVSKSVSVVNDNEINLTSPTCTFNSAVDVRVYNPTYGFSAWQSGLFTFTAVSNPPVINSINYPGASVFGGPCDLTMQGSHFTGTYLVFVAGNPATFSVLDDSTIHITNTPAGPSGAVDVVALNGDGASNPYSWQLYQTPRVTAVSPSTGSSSGGTSITVTGYALTNMSECEFYGSTQTTTAIGITPTSDNEATFTTPAHVAELVQLRGFNNTYGYGNFSNPIYTFTAVAPVINLVNGTPSGSGQSGAYAYGIPSNANIGIDGSGFTGATNVYLGAQLCGFTVNNDTSITINSVPSISIGPKSIQVETAAGFSNVYSDFILTETPVITQLSPTSGSTSGGTNVSVYGYGFTTMNSFQFFGTNNSSVVPTVYTDSYATLVTPAYATAEAVQVRGFNPIGGAGAFVSGLWTFTPPPTFNLGNIMSSQNNGVASAGNVVNNQSSGTRAYNSQSGNILYTDFAGSNGPWDANGTSASPGFLYGFGGLSGDCTDNLAMTGDGTYATLVKASTNQLYGFIAAGPYDFSSVSLVGPSADLGPAGIGTNSGWALDYYGYYLYSFDASYIRQFNLPSQYSLSGIINGSDDAVYLPSFGINSYVRAGTWNNAGNHLYIMTQDGKIYKFTTPSPWNIGLFGAPVLMFDFASPSVSSIIGSINTSYHSCGISIKGDTENKMMAWVHTSYNFANENFLCTLYL